MLGFGWLALRQAREALKNGRLEDAQRILSQSAAQGQRGRAALLARLARDYVERGERQLKAEDPEPAWRDLLAAEGLQPGERGAARLREALTRLGVAEVRALLQAGEPGRAEESGARLRGRGVRSPELQVLEDAARTWMSGRELADQGELPRAADHLDRVRRLLIEPARVLEDQRDELERRRRTFAELLVRLHEAADAGHWREALELSEQVLATAPEHAEARHIRARAWKAVEPVTVAQRGPLPDTDSAPPADDGHAGRYLLWVDGVGGYLVCLGSRVTLGQAAPDARVDVPLVADVSRLHGLLTRDAEGYLLEGVRGLQVNGAAVTRALLRPGDRVTLGPSCQLQFRQPVPVSTSARLDLVSGHRLPLGLDGVLLMADTLVLAGGPQAHVTVPGLTKPVVLFRYKDGLGVRHPAGLTVDGRPVPERAPLGPRAAVAGDDFAFALEPVGARL
jgi:tetratricopeptide (TPR) repeat protein